MRVILSMTTVPARNGTLGPTLASLRAQTRQPDEVRLYAGPGCVAPASVDCLSVPDLGPVTKIMAVRDPALAAGDIVVTVDDDIIYDPHWLEVLVAGATAYPDEAVGMAGWNGTGPFYKVPSGYCDVLEGFAGVAYRTRFFGSDVLAPPDAARYVDDVWLATCLRRRGTKRRVLCSPMCTPTTLGVATGLHTRPDFTALNVSAMAEYARCG